MDIDGITYLKYRLRILNIEGGKLRFDSLYIVLFLQMKDLTKAASAAYTYFVHNPDNAIMKDNVQWYSSMVKTSENFINNEPMVGIKQTFPFTLKSTQTTTL